LEHAADDNRLAQNDDKMDSRAPKQLITGGVVNDNISTNPKTIDKCKHQRTGNGNSNGGAVDDISREPSLRTQEDNATSVHVPSNKSTKKRFRRKSNPKVPPSQDVSDSNSVTLDIANIETVQCEKHVSDPVMHTAVSSSMRNDEQLPSSNITESSIFTLWGLW
jgi:hypothetical protein